MEKGARLRFVFDLRDVIHRMTGWEDRTLTLRTFNIGEPPADDSDPTVVELLHAASDEDLLSLAQYLGVEAPIELNPDHSLEPGSVDTYSELVAAETAFREAIRLVLKDRWMDGMEESKIETLRNKYKEEDKRRDGVTVSADLLDYTETYQLQGIINKHWAEFKPILGDKTRTEVYFGIILDIRNSIAHSRPIVPSERLLIAGAAGQIQNQLARYRSQVSGPEAFYASINYVRDSFGEEITQEGDSQTIIPRVSVGQTISFECSATDPKGRDIHWSFTSQGATSAPSRRELGTASRSKTNFDWIVTAADVGEGRYITARIQNDSKYQRHGYFDDSVTFRFHVNPPV